MVDAVLPRGLNERLEFLEDQRSLLDRAIGRFAGNGDRYALVDFPQSSNVGDSAIWLGAAVTLRRLTGRHPVYVCAQDTSRLEGLEACIGNGTIYVTGGGNLGDLWPGHQRLREALLNRFRGNRIVQLPQSIHFSSDEALQRCAAAIKAHGSFHLLVRDRESQRFAERHFDCTVLLSPDCTFALGALQPSRAPRYDLYCLFRTDQERVESDRSSIDALGPQVEDWQRGPTLPWPFSGLWVRGRRAFTAILWNSARARLFERVAKRRLARGIEMLSSGRQVVTDRLHGHILCLMLGIPHVALADRTGKIAAYRRTWMNRIPEAVVPRNAGETVSALAALSKRPWRASTCERGLRGH